MKELKVKLERIVGIPSNIQKIIINDVEISNNYITLDELNVYNLSTVKVSHLNITYTSMFDSDIVTGIRYYRFEQ